MTDRPILFSGPMVRALIAGTKTQTRRVIPEKMQDAYFEYDDWCSNVSAGIPSSRQWEREFFLERIRIAVGDRLYVRERWVPLAAGGDMSHIADATYSMTVDGAHQHRSGRYQPGLEKYADGAFDRFKWRPGIHMPRWASRITLTVTDVRVERLQDISERDAIAEGMTQATADAIMGADELAMYAATHILCPDARGRILYETIWDQINGAGAWAANPWVAAYTFTVAMGNIDAVKT